MRRDQMKFLAELPAEYEYEFIKLNNKMEVIGKKEGLKLIGFFIEEEKLVPIDFEFK